MISSALLLSGSSGYVNAPMGVQMPSATRGHVQMAAETDGWKAAGLAAAVALATGVQSASAGPFTRSEISSLTYDQVRSCYCSG